MPIGRKALTSNWFLKELISQGSTREAAHDASPASFFYSPWQLRGGKPNAVFSYNSIQMDLQWQPVPNKIQCNIFISVSKYIKFCVKLFFLWQSVTQIRMLLTKPVKVQRLCNTGTLMILCCYCSRSRSSDFTRYNSWFISGGFMSWFKYEFLHILKKVTQNLNQLVLWDLIIVYLIYHSVYKNILHW